jgi:hypothetical protein
MSAAVHCPRNKGGGFAVSNNEIRTAEPMSPTEVHIRLQELQAERALASIEGLASDSAYMADLDQEIVAIRSAYVGAAVTEIASLRAQLSGPQTG